jgi:serine/threonine protein kinase/Tol biopolymer transport system component
VTPERWREIERLYHAALEHDSAGRPAFLTEACGDDAGLRQEVESLLTYQGAANDFMALPAVTADLARFSPIAGAVRRTLESSVPGRLVGRVFGSYEVQALIATGGMGEVYRAVDTRLNRTVAIKTLRGQLSDDPDRQERFRREANIVSSLNHPHICTLYDVGIQDGIHYLVMEHIDGETLQARLERGPLPLVRALEYATQMCDALDKAHRHGVIHRDLKPANVMLAKPGVKLLDFGVAKIARAPAQGPDGAHTRTLTSDGAILGTFQYMAPEQVEGKDADARTDIFAFGALVYEMITAKKAFDGPTQANLIGAILRDDPPPIIEIVPDVPVSVDRVIARCLAKDPDDRWQTANDLLFELRSITSPAAAGVRRPRVPSRRVERAVWMAIVIASVAGAGFWAQSRNVRLSAPTTEAPAVRYTVFPADGITLYSVHGPPLALSPDGRSIVYVGATADGPPQLWLRSLYSQREQALPGTDGANTPFWSSDSQWIGFFAANSLKKVRISSGLTQVVATNVQNRGGATWNAADVILFQAWPGGLSRVSAQGGQVTTVTKGEGVHFWPQFLADDQHFIYADSISRSIYIGSLDNDRPRRLMTFPVRISSLAHVPGYILFVQDASLVARPFDETRLEFTGEAIPLLDGIPVSGPGRASFSVSASGVLAYWPYPAGVAAALRWFGRDGRESSPAVSSPAQYAGFALSPDGQRLVFSRAAPNGSADLWLRDVVEGTEQQLTFDGAAFTPQWSPDGTRIVFSGPGESPPPKLFIRNITNTTPASQFAVAPTPNFASSWSADGHSIVSVRIDRTNQGDLWVQRVQDGAAERLSFNTPFNESQGKVSPDDRWIAYVTDESGADEVWVARFPSGDDQHPVSVGGGTSPQWGAGGKEILYMSGDNHLMAAPFTDGQTGMNIGSPRALFPIRNVAESDRLLYPTANTFVTASNGQRFLVAVRGPRPDAPPINIVVNWHALLNR